ncbi:MAG: TraB/GumN family protein [Candidatus Aenigmarchaeota archaeon]|nr:TraB/GumN family protein [Candidatus Aenigmarchaeota archaeon]
MAKQSLEAIKHSVDSEKPDCIAVELDINRYNAMKSEQQLSWHEAMSKLGVFTYVLYWVMKRLQIFFGKKTGIIPGSEMLRAVEIARERGIPIAFIDQDITLTFLGIKNIDFNEKVKLFWLLIKAVIGIRFPFLPGKKEKIDLQKVPEKKLVNEAMALLRKEMPGLYKVLVENRDRFMARNLIALTERFEKIVCVIGAGHEEGIKNILKAYM